MAFCKFNFINLNRSDIYIHVSAQLMTFKSLNFILALYYTSIYFPLFEFWKTIFQKMTAKYNPRQKLSTVLLKTITERNCDSYSLHGVIGWLGILTFKKKLVWNQSFVLEFLNFASLEWLFLDFKNIYFHTDYTNSH